MATPTSDTDSTEDTQSDDTPDNSEATAEDASHRASDDAGTDTSSDESGEQGDGRPHLDRDDESQSFVDQSIMDFDPDDGLYSGTVVDGSTEIDGPHIGDDGTVDEEEEKQFLEDGKKQAKEEGLLDEDDEPTAKGSDAKGSGETGEDSASDDGDAEAKGD